MLQRLFVLIFLQQVAQQTGTVQNTYIIADGSGGTADSVAWEDVTGKPSTFPPDDHTHTAAQVGALPATYTPPVTSVNGKTGAVTLSASNVGAARTRRVAESVTSLSIGSSVTLSEAVPDGSGVISSRVGYIGGTGAAYGSNPVRLSVSAVGEQNSKVTIYVAIFTLSSDRKTITLERAHKVSISSGGAVSYETDVSVQFGPVYYVG